MIKKLGIAFVAIILAVGGWYYFSPRYTLHQMKTAAVAKDSEKLSRYVDYDALRADLKADLRRAMMKEMTKQPSNGWEALGSAIAMAIVDPMIDAMVSPEGVQAMFEQQKAKEAKQGKAALPTVAAGEDPIIERNGIDEFKVKGRDSESGAIVFKRAGFSWKMVAVELPEQP
jgi:hypothetical protein